MSAARAERLAELSRRAECEREILVAALADVSEDVRSRRATWKIAGMAATALAAGGTAAWRLFGKSSHAARIGRAASGASILLGVGRAFFRLRRFL